MESHRAIFWASLASLMIFGTFAFLIGYAIKF
jgi:hypothetical protein